MGLQNEKPGAGSLDIEYVGVFNKLARTFAEQADKRYSFFSDLIYDANLVLKELESVTPSQAGQLYWYIRPMGTYMRHAGNGIDFAVPCSAGYVILLDKLEYGTPLVELRELYGPFNMGAA
jgi:hypothetical protein